MLDISTIPKFHVYCDESSQNKHRYLVIGAMFCRASVAPKIAKTIDVVLKPHGGTSELKWTKLTRRRKDMYFDCYKAIWQLIDANHMQFYALVVDTSKVNHRLYNDGDKDLGFTKFLFTLLFKFARIFKGTHRLYVFLDNRTTRHTPEKLRETLNAKARKEIQQVFPPFRTVQFVDSVDSRLIQLADLVCGLIAYETNLHHTGVDAAKHKVQILNEAQKLFKVSSFAIPTPYSRTDGFDIWHLDFDAKARRAARA